MLWGSLRRMVSFSLICIIPATMTWYCGNAQRNICNSSVVSCVDECRTSTNRYIQFSQVWDMSLLARVISRDAMVACAQKCDSRIAHCFASSQLSSIGVTVLLIASAAIGVWTAVMGRVQAYDHAYDCASIQCPGCFNHVIPRRHNVRVPSGMHTPIYCQECAFTIAQIS